MEKLTGLSTKENSGEQLLGGLYRLTIDVSLSPDDKITLPDLEKRIESVAGKVEDHYIERHVTASFNTGDVIEFTSEYVCEKPVYIDTSGNLVITDSPVMHSVEKVGTFSISLPKGTIAEINQQSVDGTAEVLFSGFSVEVSELSKEAFLGILKLPHNILIKFEEK